MIEKILGAVVFAEGNESEILIRGEISKGRHFYALIEVKDEKLSYTPLKDDKEYLNKMGGFRKPYLIGINEDDK